MSEPVVGESRRFTERAFVLTLAAFILLTPPILGIFDVPVLIFGIPLLHIYTFAVWLAAIAYGRWLSMRMAARRGHAAPDALASGTDDRS